MSGRVVTPAMEAEILRRWNESPSPSEIGRALGLARTTVQNVVRRAGLPLNAPVWRASQAPARAELMVQNLTHSSGMGKVLGGLEHAETNARNSEIDELREAVAAQNELIQRLLNGEIRSRSAQAPVVQDCERRVRRVDSSENRRVLIIPDTHAPYHHPDTLPFLEALLLKYRPDRIIHLGDELDYHFSSYHETETGAHGADRELELGREFMWELDDLIQRTAGRDGVDAVECLASNHGSLPFRKAKTGGVPRHLITPYRDAIFGEDDGDGGLIRRNGRGDAWRWHDSLTINVPNSLAPVYFAHGIAADPRNAVRRMHSHIVQGHYHTEYSIRYDCSEHLGMLWGISSGCLVDRNAIAMSYAKTATPTHQAIGASAIIEGVPVLLPMIRDKKNRWTGLVP